MKQKFSLLILFICISCSSTNNYRPSNEVENFVSKWSSDFAIEDNKVVSTYQNYLASVEELLNKAGVSHKFGSYLSGINNTYQILSHEEYLLPEFFRKQTGKRADRNPRDFGIFKVRRLTSLRKELFKERESKLQKEFGADVFKQLNSNYDQFIKNHQVENLDFPL